MHACQAAAGGAGGAESGFSAQFRRTGSYASEGVAECRDSASDVRLYYRLSICHFTKGMLIVEFTKPQVASSVTADLPSLDCEVFQLGPIHDGKKGITRRFVP